MTEKHGTYIVPGQLTIRRETRLPFSDLKYESPTADEIRAVLKQAGLTGSMAGQLLGVDGRTIRKWTGGERDIPYSAWRLLLHEYGVALDSL